MLENPLQSVHMMAIQVLLDQVQCQREHYYVHQWAPSYTFILYTLLAYLQNRFLEVRELAKEYFTFW